MMSRSSSSAAVAPATRPLFAPRPRRLATGNAPAALIVLVWALLWAWVSAGVAAPLSRIESTRPAAVESAAPRA